MRMYGGGREKKTKPAKAGRSRASAAEHEDDVVLKPVQASRKAKKGSKRDNKYDRDDENFQPDESTANRFLAPRRGMGARDVEMLAENVFMQWEELLGSREALKRRVDTIAAVHGWEGRSSRRSFLGGIEPASLLESIKSEIVALDPACEALERADILLEVRVRRAPHTCCRWSLDFKDIVPKNVTSTAASREVRFARGAGGGTG